jgi:hypothetical protein
MLRNVLDNTNHETSLSIDNWLLRRAPLVCLMVDSVCIEHCACVGVALRELHAHEFDKLFIAQHVLNIEGLSMCSL